MIFGCLGCLWGIVIALWRRKVLTRMRWSFDEMPGLVDSVCSWVFR